MPTIALKALLEGEKAITQLLQFGEAPSKPLSELTFGTELGLWYISKDGERCVATSNLRKLLFLAGKEEAKASVFGCEPNIRAEWLRIVAARLKEIGGRRDAENLCHTIETLGSSAGKDVLAIIESNSYSMAQTPYSELEYKIFADYASDASVWPRLLRSISYSSSIIEGKSSNVEVEALPDVELFHQQHNWVKGRLILYPGRGISRRPSKTTILSGSCQPLDSSLLTEATNESEAMMLWILASPWMFLLTELIYVQEAWAAERVTGGLTLLLPEKSIPEFNTPQKVYIMITLPSGDEVLCGSLGELLVRTLDNLGVGILASKKEIDKLDEALAPLIEQLLKSKVWQFNYYKWQKRASYSISNSFSTVCYRRLGTKYFYLTSTKVIQALRNTCEQWATDMSYLPN